MTDGAAPGPQWRRSFLALAVGTALVPLMLTTWLCSGWWDGTGGGSSTWLLMQRMTEALTTYAAAHKQRYPDTLQDAEKYMPDGRVPTDQWGNPFVYTRISDKEYQIVSYGADGEPGGQDADTHIVAGGRP